MILIYNMVNIKGILMTIFLRKRLFMKRVKVFIVLMSLVLSINVYAVDSSESIGSDLNQYSCTSFQDKNMHISGDTYFGRCMQATCNGSKWTLKYYSTNSVSCSNGNLNPYTKITKTGCSNYQGNRCSGSAVKYCTTITYFDCERTSNGSKFTTTTKKKKTTTKTTTIATTTTTTTEVVKNNNTNLSNINLSTGSINFSKDVKEYSIEVGSTISFITVNATPEADTSKVVVTGNTNLVTGKNTITITVTAEDGSTGVYTIIVTKGEALSKNAKLTSISINGINLDKFNSTTYNYTYETKESSIKVEAEVEDINAIYMVNGADNIKDGSIVKIIVTAADGLTMSEYSITIDAPSSSAGLITVIFIIIILIVVGGGIFYFYTRQKNGGEKEYEYE